MDAYEIVREGHYARFLIEVSKAADERYEEDRTRERNEAVTIGNEK